MSLRALPDLEKGAGTVTSSTPVRVSAPLAKVLTRPPRCVNPVEEPANWERDRRAYRFRRRFLTRAQDDGQTDQLVDRPDPGTTSLREP